jgi:diguanylate cyclase (GGDEF)-like protein/PAS domain S-box-containing protein
MSRMEPVGDRKKSDSTPNSTWLWQQMVESSWDMYGVFNERGEAVHAALSSIEWLGKVPKHFVDLLHRLHSDDRSKLRNAWVRMLRQAKPLDLELRLKDCRGKQIWMEARLIRIETEESEALFCVMMRDISTRKSREQTLEQMANYDPLTGLANRRYFKEHLDRSMAYAVRNSIQLAVLCIDVDLFKRINDTFGHEVGDEFLRDFAARLRRVLRETDLPARIGGDEFIVVLPDVGSREGACFVAERLVAALSNEWHVGNHSFHATVSVGVAVYPDHSKDSTELLRCADQAMYAAKRNGGNQFKLYGGIDPT